MKKIILFCMVVLLISPLVKAADRVVVIPLNAKKATTCIATNEVLSEGQCWMDRNLGAARVAINSTDTLAYGDLYQWGRLGDGHQYRTSSTIPTNSAHDVPRHSSFILETVSPFDWRDPQNNNMWQGASGTYNPCPTDFRVPTQAEFETERASWDTDDAAGAFGSPLKLVRGGYRFRTTGSFNGIGISGDYWTSTASGGDAVRLSFNSSSVAVVSDDRAYGYSVRCIKD